MVSSLPADMNSPIPLNNLKRNLGVGKDLPKSYAAVSDDHFPGGG